jgi:hypothetical protein
MKYCLGLCELHYNYLHGGNENHGHYLLIDTFDGFNTKPSNVENGIDEEEDSDDEDEDEYTIFDTAEWYNEKYIRMIPESKRHVLIRNYSTIVRSPNYIKPEIMEKHVLETGETVVILKTVWIRVFQRKCRNYFAKRLAKYKNIHNILNRRLKGK